jgi:AP2-associated kinase
VENILLHDKIFKLCDFGSASTERVDLALLSKLEVSRCEEEFEKNTTMMYRPPEMSDIYQKYEVNEKVDIWMLGCVLYNICYYEHPF